MGHVSAQSKGKSVEPLFFVLFCQHGKFKLTLKLKVSIDSCAQRLKEGHNNQLSEFVSVDFFGGNSFRVKALDLALYL